MAIDYTTWPTVSNLADLLASANITLPSAVTTDVKQMRIDSAVSLIEHTTGRRFKAGSTSEVRCYDGSGTGMIEIDEYISISSIYLFQIPSQTTVQLTNWFEVERVPFPKTQVQIMQGPANQPYGYWYYFPKGRSNVQITGQFGYGANIPSQVWQSVLAKAAADMADSLRVTQYGILDGFRDLDQDFKWSDQQIGMLAGWRQDFAAACKQFRRPLKSQLRRNMQALV